MQKNTINSFKKIWFIKVGRYSPYNINAYVAIIYDNILGIIAVELESTLYLDHRTTIPTSIQL